MKKTRMYVAIIIVSLTTVILFSIMSASTMSIIKRGKRSNSNEYKEIVYVYNDRQEMQTDSEENKALWVVKEYMGIIGVFDSSGELRETIDTHVKTLPMKDQILLGEGIEVNNAEGLYLIIEAYSD